MKTLEHDIAIWRKAAVAGDSVQDPMALCIVDGSRTMFSPPYLQRGLTGGRQAAERLLCCIQDRLEASRDEYPNMTLSAHNVTISVYCAKAQLVESISDKNICNSDQVDAFLAGFGQVSTLISVVDVVDQASVDMRILGKLQRAHVSPFACRADLALIDYLRTFAGLPQVTHVFYAGRNMTS